MAEPTEQFSRLVYKCPGEHKCGPGQYFKHKHVTSVEAQENAFQNGWFDTLPEAIKDHYNKKPVPVLVESPPVAEEPPKKAQPFGFRTKKAA